MRGCIFCDIVAKRAPAASVHEDEICVACMDVQPVNAGHVLLLPKRHVGTLDDCDDAVARHLISALKRLNRAVQAATGCQGVLNEIMNGAAAGQEIAHLHLHVIPRNAGDGFGWVYPKGYGPARREQLDAMAAKIRSQFASVGERND